MRRKRFGFAVSALFGLALQSSGCGQEPHGACLVRAADAIICYDDASASCCQKLLGEFHSEDVCSTYQSTQVMNASTCP